MVKVCIERIIDVPVDEAWTIFSDVMHIDRIHPMVASVDQLSPNQSRGMNAMRQCNFYDGHYVQEEIVEWSDEDRHFRINILDTDLPLTKATGEFWISAHGKSQTLLKARMTMKAKYGVVGKLMEYLVLRPQMGHAIGDVFAGVEEYHATGKEIVKGYHGKSLAMISSC